METQMFNSTQMMHDPADNWFECPCNRMVNEAEVIADGCCDNCMRVYSPAMGEFEDFCLTDFGNEKEFEDASAVNFPKRGQGRNCC